MSEYLFDFSWMFTDQYSHKFHHFTDSDRLKFKFKGFRVKITPLCFQTIHTRDGNKFTSTGPPESWKEDLSPNNKLEDAYIIT